jgi:hypothetical protein
LVKEMGAELLMEQLKIIATITEVVKDEVSE